MTQGALEHAAPRAVIKVASRVKNEVTIDDTRVKDIDDGRLERHELAVIGTHVDRRVVPGFMYSVRVADGTSEPLFDGRPLMLESVGRGYGKRITFESDSRNESPNYFYSDSAAHGYAFAPVAVRVRDQFDVVPSSGGGHADATAAAVAAAAAAGHEVAVHAAGTGTGVGAPAPDTDVVCGRLQVVNVTRPQREIAMYLDAIDGRTLWKLFEVHFTAKVLTATDRLLSCKVRSWTSVDCVGVCYVVRRRGVKRAEIDHIDLKIGSCLAGFKLVPPSNRQLQHHHHHHHHCSNNQQNHHNNHYYHQNGHHV